MQQEIEYNPSLSISENAKANGISVDAMRYYIKKNGIDRRYEQKIAIINLIIKYRKWYPDATQNEIARRTKKSVNTIKKYWNYAKGDDVLLPSVKGDKQSSLNIHNNEYFTIPDEIIKYLFTHNYWKIGNRVFDPCNNGNVAQAVSKQSGFGREKEYEVFADNIAISDIERFKRTDYVPYNVDIITIPPENNRLEIVKKCVESARRIAAIYMPLKYLFIKDKGMDEVFKYGVPVMAYAYYPSMETGKNEDYVNVYQESKDVYALFIWDNSRRYRNRTTIYWIK